MTWLFIPSTPSASAPAEAASIWPSSWQCLALEQHVLWRSKRSPSRIWFQRYGRVSWLPLLFGAMPEPSTAGRGVALWMQSLAASRAKLIATPAGNAASSTSVISGRRPGASSSKPGRGLSGSRTSAACSPRGLTKSLAPKEFVETYESWVTRLREASLRRQKLARRMSASASSSLASTKDLPTPIAADTKGPSPLDRRPVCDDDLATAAQRWPTPAARDWKGANSADHLEVSKGSLHLDQLPNFVEHLWRTPTTQSENAMRGKGQTPEGTQNRIDGGHTLRRGPDVTRAT